MSGKVYPTLEFAYLSNFSPADNIRDLLCEVRRVISESRCFRVLCRQYAERLRNTTRILFGIACVLAKMQTLYLSKISLDISFPPQTILKWPNMTKLYFPRDGGLTGRHYLTSISHVSTDGGDLCSSSVNLGSAHSGSSYGLTPNRWQTTTPTATIRESSLKQLRYRTERMWQSLPYRTVPAADAEFNQLAKRFVRTLRAVWCKYFVLCVAASWGRQPHHVN
jgi:hypothetical protein